MITGDFPVPLNNEQGPDGLRNITPYLDLTELLGADLIRIAMKVEDDILWAQRAADEAAERGIRLAHQSHTQSLFETVDGSVDVLKRVGRTRISGLSTNLLTLISVDRITVLRRSSGFRLIFLMSISRITSVDPMEKRAS